jgi:hypothetical protein
MRGQKREKRCQSTRAKDRERALERGVSLAVRHKMDHTGPRSIGKIGHFLPPSPFSKGNLLSAIFKIKR